jgi:hypothetical protein
MRIHYEIDDDLHRRAKAAAALRGQTLKECVEEPSRSSWSRPRRVQGK